MRGTSEVLYFCVVSENSFRIIGISNGTHDTKFNTEHSILLLSWGHQADAGFLCDKVAMVIVAIKERLCRIITTIQLDACIRNAENYTYIHSSC